MTLIQLDSRMCMGTDCQRRPSEQNQYREMSGVSVHYAPTTMVRVIVGNWGTVIRMSAPALDIVVEASSREETWAKFLSAVKSREDFAWFTFDVGPTRRDEIKAGLNIPEDEDWSELMRESEDD